MSDLISRSALLEEMKRMQMDIVAKATAIKTINQQPTVEAKPVVHCKDCVHWGTGVAGETEHVKCCEYGKYMVGENGYCCYGADMRTSAE